LVRGRRKTMVYWIFLAWGNFQQPPTYTYFKICESYVKGEKCKSNEL
jgi:hypothetical protein